MAPIAAPPDCPRISRSDLHPGDVLLSNGSDWIDKLICRLDDGIYSHAAIWDGNCVIEATLRGVLRSSLEDEETQLYVDAYRWQPEPPAGHVLGDAAYPYQPVTAQADKLADEGLGYAYKKLMLAALVIGMSKVPANRVTRRLVRIVLDELAAWIVDQIDKGGKRGMTCTEVVSTSFWQAAADEKYAIKIVVDGSRDDESLRAVAQGPLNARARGSRSDYEREKRECLELFLKADHSVKRRDLAALAAAHFGARAKGVVEQAAGGPDVPLACVTPRDLQRSPDLKCIGRLSERAGAATPDTTPADLSRLLGRL